MSVSRVVYIQVVPEDVIDNLIRVCHSDSYDKLDSTVQVNVSGDILTLYNFIKI